MTTDRGGAAARHAGLLAALAGVLLAGAGRAGDWTVLDTKMVSHGRGIQRIAVSPDGKLLASANPSMVKLWDISGDTPKETLALRGIKGMDGAGVRSLLFLPDGKTLAAGVGGNTLRLLDYGGGKLQERLKLEDQTGNVQSLAVSPDGKTLAAGSDDLTVLLYDITGPRPKERLRFKPDKGRFGVKAIHYTPDGTRMVIGFGNGAVRLWDLSGPEPTERASANVATATFQLQSALCAGGKLLAIGDEKNRAVQLWEVAEDKFVPRHTWRDPKGKEIGGMARSPQGTILAVADKAGRFVLYDVESNEKLLDKQLSGHFEDVAFVPGSGEGGKPLRLVLPNWTGNGQMWVLSVGPGK